MPNTVRHGRWGRVGEAVAWLRAPSLWGGVLVTVVLAGCILWGLLVLGTSFVVAQQGSPGWWLVLVFGLLFLPVALAAAYAIPAYLLRARRRGSAQPALRAVRPGTPPLSAPPVAASAASSVAHVPAVGQAPQASAPPPHPVASAARRPVEPLSRRELEVLELLAAGRSNRQIAEALFVAPGTVKAHLNHIFGKLEATSRLQAVAHAREAGLLDAHDSK